jgi:mRNA-degrading endonuclease toxin of MazEF toxin-antitoxin module
VGQQVPDFLLNPNDQTPSAALAPNRSSGSDKKGLVIVLSVLAAFLTTMVLVVLYIVRRRRHGTAHVITSPKSLRQADSTQMDADGKVLRDSLHAASSRDLQLSQSRSNGSSRMFSKSSSRDLEFTESGEEVEMGMDDIL